MAGHSEVAISGYGIMRFTPLPSNGEDMAVVRIGIPTVSKGRAYGESSRWMIDLDPYEALSVAEALVAAARRTLAQSLPTGGGG